LIESTLHLRGYNVKNEIKKKHSLFLPIPSCPRVVGVAYWRKHCGKMAISDKAMVSDKDFAFLLLENYWESWKLNMHRNTQQKWHMTKAQTKRGKGKQLG